jgi:triphosphoribosyl-dephospho-CoA synthetase
MPDISINPNSAFGVGYPQNQNSVNQPLDEQSVAAFEAAMSDTSPATVSSAAPAAIDFKTQVAALSPEQQKLINSALAATAQANDEANTALLAAINAKPTDPSSPAQLEVFWQKLGEAQAKMNTAVDQGLAFVNVLIEIDSKLPRSIPQYGESLLTLLNTLPGTSQQINFVKEAFGISP